MIATTTATNTAWTVKAYRSSTFSASNQMNTSAGDPITMSALGSATATIVFTNYNVFDGTQPLYLVVDTTGSWAPTTTGTKSLSATITGYVWKDTATGSDITGVIVPVAGATNSYSY
jgi:hypothetical protein